MLEQFMLTTFDNPFNPFENFRDWFVFDIEKGYKCCEIVDRISNVTNEMSSTEKILAQNDAIERFIAVDPLNIYTKVSIKTKMPLA